jgi:glycosyltransferase involved in cell wall biosynthesis
VEGLARPFEIVYNGVDTELFSPIEGKDQQRTLRVAFGLPQERRLLLCVATPIRAKGWLDLFDAWKELSEEVAGWDLVMVGAPRAADDLDLMAEARTREFGSRAHWLGILPPEKMPDLYRAVDAFVLASHHEGLSNSMMEAMATGLPVIVTHVGGHKEIIEDGINGRMVPPGDPPTLAAALRDVLTNPARATGLGHAARDRAVAVGDYRANASMLLRSLKDVLCSRKVQSQMEALLK